VHTVGPAVALRLRAFTGPGGLHADGEDVLLVDVEAVDAMGDRVPTFQRRVDFTLTGPGIWRGGYDSGKINSINNPWLDLEAGINRVSIRAGRTPGKITLTARCEGLRSADVSTFSVQFTGALPALPVVTLPVKAPPRHIDPARFTSAENAKPAEPTGLGRYIRTLNYTGPNAAIVHVETDAAPGKNAYVNADSPFVNLPAGLAGADWVQVDNRDALYSAVDLMEIAVAAPATVTIAHDHRLPPPAWLARSFQPTGQSITVLGQPMDLFVRNLGPTESLTLGANTDNTSLTEGNLYLVFVSQR
jgi:beta-galactosidase